MVHKYQGIGWLGNKKGTNCYTQQLGGSRKLRQLKKTNFPKSKPVWFHYNG